MDSKSHILLLNDDNEKLHESAIIERLKMTPEERIDAHENARQLLNDLKTAGDASLAKPQSPT